MYETLSSYSIMYEHFVHAHYFAFFLLDGIEAKTAYHLTTTNITTRSTKLQQCEISNKEMSIVLIKITIIYMVLIMDNKH